jgi:phosphate transport system protein
MKHFLQEMEQLTGELLQLTSTVEGAIQQAIQSLYERRTDLAEKVIRGDDAIDQQEVQFEEECIRVLVLQQPVATDLRRLVAAIKINSDLERMADLAAEIAEQARALALLPDRLPLPTAFQAMTSRVVRMVRGSLDAFVQFDPERARAIGALDEEIKRDHVEIVRDLKATIRTQPELIDAGFHLFSAARYLERIADHATNIAEDVVYMKEGAIIRHRRRPEAGAAGSFVQEIPHAYLPS